jgi:ribosome-associated toxin RatA of RatAB toxin-antitoxin module
MANPGRPTAIDGLRHAPPHRLNAQEDSMPSFVADRVVAAPAEQVWAVVADLAGYARIAPGLSHVEILNGDREGLRRRCYDNRGRGWNETCTLWEPGHRYRMQVDTASHPFPLRQLLRRFQGTWSVDAVPGGTRITVQFDAEPRLGSLGRLALRAMGGKAHRDLTQLLDNYEQAIRTHRTADRPPA